MVGGVAVEGVGDGRCGVVGGVAVEGVGDGRCGVVGEWASGFALHVVCMHVHFSINRLSCLLPVLCTTFMYSNCPYKVGSTSTSPLLHFL